MPGTVKTEGVVLRSIRFGEADRILHLYTAGRGRVNAIAKGSRRPKSRFGGRLEPFFRLELMLYEGRGELLTVTGAETLDGYPALRSDGPAIDAAARACDAVLRLLDAAEPNRPAYNLLCRYLSLLDRGAAPAPAGEIGPPAAGTAAGLAFRIKLALAAGFSPELGSCARCGERSEIAAFSGAAGGVVCAACEGGGFPLGREAHEFMVAAIGRPMAELPRAEGPALRQVERAIGDTLAHHAHVQLRSVA
jgi:DNA repair protein RecO (recombination protein O)